MEHPKEPILYVDDETENLQGFNYLLRRDFEVYLATSAKEGIEILRQHDIKVVLSDQRMPEMTGIEFLEQVIAEFPDTIRIIITAYSDSDTILQAINQGKVYHFITKPWNNTELKNIIKRAVETYNLRHDKQQLISYLQGVNLELKTAKDKAEESDRLKSSFLANMSHEIRTPLNAIVGFSNLLLADTNDVEMRKQFVSIIESSSGDLLNIIEDILDTSRIESGFVSLHESVVDVHRLMCDLLLVFQNHNQLREKPVELNYKYPNIAEKLPVYTDGLRLKQILSNLLNNAIKFTEEGQIEFGYEIEGDDPNQTLQLFVRDTGIGIASEKYEYIFERFHKIETDKDHLYRGNGLGLYIARRLSNLLGGDISVKSFPGKGSTFYVTLPYIAKTKTDVKEVMGSFQFLKQSWPGKTIMVVEDESSNYKYIEALLANRVKLIWVKSGIEAVDMIGNLHIDLILMDVKLPRMDGFQATKLIKEKNQTVPIIAVTAYAMEADKNESIQAGCDNYIAKPFKMEELFSLINTYIAS